MKKTTKIVLGIGIPLVVFGAYWFLYRNRKPNLNLDKTDWSNNISNIKFGRNKQSVPLGNNGKMNAGATYSPNEYELTFTSSGKIMVFSVRDKNGNLVDKQTLDFGAKIKY
jgi:hypothetical protein